MDHTTEIKERGVSTNDAVKEGKGSRTPRNYESIERGALSLSLEERVGLRNRLTLSIDGEIKEMQEKLNAANALVSPINQR